MEKILKKISRGVVIVVLNIVFRTVYRMKVIGKENIPRKGALIFCGNHKSYFDPPAIAITNGRKMSFLAKEELKGNMLFAFLGWAFENIWVKPFTKNAIIYGKPLDLSKYENVKIDKDIEEKVNEELKSKILELIQV